MKKAGYTFIAAAAAFSVMATGCGSNVADRKNGYRPKTDAELVSAAKDAYIYGFPLVLSEIEKKYMTAASGTPVNAVKNISVFPDASFRIFSNPEPFVFTSFAWLDLSSEPFVFDMPEIDGRYAFFSVADAWKNEIISIRSYGRKLAAQKTAIAGPAWSGVMPEGVTAYRSGTNTVFLSLRIQVKDVRDAAAVKKIQGLLKLYPLSFYGMEFKPPVLKQEEAVYKNSPVEQAFSMSLTEYFNLLNQSMVSNLPFPADAEALDNFLDLGVAPGMRFDMSGFSYDLKDSLNKVPLLTEEYIKNKIAGRLTKGWLVSGDFKTDYISRASAAFAGLKPDTGPGAVYAKAYVDDEGETLDGSKNKYTLHFDKDIVPAAGSFWSVALYGTGGFFVKNGINRFAAGSADNLKYNKDGSLDIYIQTSNPGTGKNRLPCPSGEFTLIFRQAADNDSAPASAQLPGISKIKGDEKK